MVRKYGYSLVFDVICTRPPIWFRSVVTICDPCVSHLASILQEHMYTICEPYGLDVLLPSVIHVLAIWHQYCKTIMYTICKPYGLDLLSPSVIHVLAIWHQYCKNICIPICEPCVKQFLQNLEHL